MCWQQISFMLKIFNFVNIRVHLNQTQTKVSFPCKHLQFLQNYLSLVLQPCQYQKRCKKKRNYFYFFNHLLCQKDNNLTFQIIIPTNCPTSILADGALMQSYLKAVLLNMALLCKLTLFHKQVPDKSAALTCLDEVFDSLCHRYTLYNIWKKQKETVQHKVGRMFPCGYPLRDLLFGFLTDVQYDLTAKRALLTYIYLAEEDFSWGSVSFCDFLPLFLTKTDLLFK